MDPERIWRLSGGRGEESKLIIKPKLENPVRESGNSLAQEQYVRWLRIYGNCKINKSQASPSAESCDCG